MTGTEICDVFDKSFGEVTQKLICVDLQKTTENKKNKMPVLQHGYWELIQTKGYINAQIICHFSEDLFQCIIDTMNGGCTPPKEEIALYLNEYVNIICGHAISKLNNMVKKPSRLSVPSFYRTSEPLHSILDNNQPEFLAYSSKAGKLQVYICCSTENDQKEDAE